MKRHEHDLNPNLRDEMFQPLIFREFFFVKPVGRYSIGCSGLELGGYHLDVTISGDQCRSGSRVSTPQKKPTSLGDF